MAWRVWVCSAALAASLVACDSPSGKSAKGGADASQSEGKAPGVALVETAADPCATQSGALGRALCGDPDLSPLAATLRSKLVAAAGEVSEAGAKEFAEAQKSWVEATQVACGLSGNVKTLSAEAKACVRSKLEERTKGADDAARPIGGFTFQTVEINRAQVVTEALAQQFGASDEVGAVEKRIRFPRIDGDSPAIRKFNDLMRQRPEAGIEDGVSEIVDYTIAYAGPELVSVRFNRSDMTLGAIRPSNSSKVVTVVMGTGEALSDRDVFSAPPARWRAALVAIARKDLVRQLGDDIDVPERELEETATKTHNWLITDDALVIVFPPESIGPHALGALEVKAPWSQLRGLLNRSGPGPIAKAAAG